MCPLLGSMLTSEPLCRGFGGFDVDLAGPCGFEGLLQNAAHTEPSDADLLQPPGALADDGAFGEQQWDLRPPISGGLASDAADFGVNKGGAAPEQMATAFTGAVL